MIYAVIDTFLVTGNLKHYPTSPRVITPVAFIDLIASFKGAFPLGDR